MAANTQKGQALVELTFVLIAIAVFAMLTVAQLQKFNKENNQNYFSVSKRAR